MLPPVIIVHYHLNPGGVTKVIETQVEALTQAGIDYLVLTGEQYSGDKGLRQTVIPHLNYNESTHDIINESEQLFDQCWQAVTERFGDQEVVWLLHNPTLGKSTLWSGLVALLSYTEQRMIMHCHDFSEDGRPSNYAITSQSEAVYPLAPNIHYALINSRDRSNLLKAGLPKENMHLLPNAVSVPKIQRDPSLGVQKVVLYPVRGIRRKNLGELLLWSAFAPKNTLFVLTLAPQNEKWLPYYKIWESLAVELLLPVHLSCADKIKAPDQDGGSFIDWLRAATHCITTSVSEGFGLTFLEPRALGIPLIGRDLPEVTSDFKEKGLKLGNFYNKILVPLIHIDQEALYNDLRDELGLCYQSYNKQYKNKHFLTAWKNMTNNGYVDFGNLPEDHQLRIITKVREEGYDDLLIQTSNGVQIKASIWIRQALSISPVVSTAQRGLDLYSPLQYQKRLVSLIQKVARSKVASPEWLNKEQVLNVYLAPEKFNFLRN